MKIFKKHTSVIITYASILIFALLFLYFGNKIASEGLAVTLEINTRTQHQAEVIQILDVSEIVNEFDGLTDKKITFEAALTKGKNKDIVVIATQHFDRHSPVHAIEVQGGDRIFVSSYDDDWAFVDYIRINQIMILGGVFVVLLLAFGRFKGLNAIISLGFTCAAIFAVFIPSILSGKNIYLTSIIICVVSVIVSLFIVYGINPKSLSAVVGCFGGIIAAGIITIAMTFILKLSGMIDGESFQLAVLPTENPVDLKAIMFAGIIIGAVGAIMDVAVSISSALWELKTQAPKLTHKEIFDSGINIGRDVMGSMTNTLVLAYIGSGLTIILLLIVYSNSFDELLNRELVIYELLQAIIGSMGILLTMPLTALVCSALYSRKAAKQ